MAWIEYDSNNSGGKWWLKDEDWQKLEEAGWHIGWIYAAKSGSGSTMVKGDHLYGDDWETVIQRKVAGEKEYPSAKDDPFNGTVIAAASSYEEAVGLAKEYGRYLGSIATSAVKQGVEPSMLIVEFAEITKQDPAAIGCNCCGPPHSFTWHADDGTRKYATAVVSASTLEWS